jgi:hypothetical protein
MYIYQAATNVNGSSWAAWLKAQVPRQAGPTCQIDAERAKGYSFGSIPSATWRSFLGWSSLMRVLPTSATSPASTSRRSVRENVSLVRFRWLATCRFRPGSLTVLSAGEKGDRPALPERPEGCFAQSGPVPFFSPGADPADARYVGLDNHSSFAAVRL